MDLYVQPLMVARAVLKLMSNALYELVFENADDVSYWTAGDLSLLWMKHEPCSAETGINGFLCVV